MSGTFDVDHLRMRTLRLIADVGSGHPGSSLSCLHLLVAAYSRVMRGVATQDVDRDRLLLSKGHGAPALYAVLAEVGILPDHLGCNLRRLGSALQGHPDRLRTPGVDASSGSLGQGLSIGVGLRLGFRMREWSSRVFVVLGDGELQEGQVWEAASAAAHFGLGGLVAIVDRNRFQHDGSTAEVHSIEPLARRWQSFGWEVDEVDGHDIEEIADSLLVESARPRVVIAHTAKGYGVPFMEGDSPWHSVKDAALLRTYMAHLEERALHA